MDRLRGPAVWAGGLPQRSRPRPTARAPAPKRRGRRARQRAGPTGPTDRERASLPCGSGALGRRPRVRPADA
eukprot:15435353-Alexandrium_andersonii.AAC.1